MQSIICTLFEGHYHYGVAGLINSLHKNGFKGDIYAGYRGELPYWANNTTNSADLILWKDAKSLHLSDSITIHFLPIVTNFQFTNYKPRFVLQLSEAIDLNGKNIFYFDPDIVIKCNWDFFISWTSFGVTVIHEITNQDMPASHPVKQMWTNIIENKNLTVKRILNSYLNAGFFGLKSSDLQFVELYQKFIEVSIDDYQIDVGKFYFYSDRSHPFFAKDQDAMNIAAMCCNAPVSEYGPEAMDFIHGGTVMSHAVGSPKPWKKKFIIMALQGMPPSLADKEYWLHANGIIHPYSKAIVAYKKVTIKIASVMGRFYKKY